MGLWRKTPQRLEQILDAELEEIVESISASRKDFAKRSTLQICLGVLLAFILIEIVGNFDKAVMANFAFSFRDPKPNPLTGWDLGAHISSSDVAVFVTALLVFNATFAVAFVATYLVPAQNEEFEYFRTSWAQSVQRLASASASLAITLSITRALEDTGLFAVLVMMSALIVAASLLVNSTYFEQKSAAMAIFDTRKRLAAAVDAKNLFLGELNTEAQVRLSVKEPQDRQEARRQLNRCRTRIAVTCLVILLLEAVGAIAAVPLTGLHGPVSASAWLTGLPLLLQAFLLFGPWALAIATFGQSSFWVRRARKGKFMPAYKAFGILLAVFQVFFWFAAYADTELWPFGVVLAIINFVAIVITVVGVYWGKRYGVGPFKYVTLHALTILDLDKFWAAAAVEEAVKKSQRGSIQSDFISYSTPAEQNGNGHKSGRIFNAKRNRA